MIVFLEAYKNTGDAHKRILERDLLMAVNDYNEENTATITSEINELIKDNGLLNNLFPYMIRYQNLRKIYQRG